MGRRVAITGLGMRTRLGENVSKTWKALIEPGTKTHHITPMDQVQWSSTLQEWTRSKDALHCSVRPGPIEQQVAGFGQVQLGMTSGFDAARTLSQEVVAEALGDASLWHDNRLQQISSERIGCTFSASKPLFHQATGYRLQAAGEISSSILPPDAINDFVTQEFGLKGESRNVVAACATGAYAIALAAQWIEEGFCDAVVAGSVEPYPHSLIEAGFRQMGVISHERVMRPFDARRSGFVFGEGAGAVILESEDHARARGCRIHAFLSGWGLGSDGHSAVAFNSNGRRIAQVIEKALDRARLSPSEVDHLNAHGTATRLNDTLETQAFRHAFGDHAEKLMISATKSATGHLLGAAGSVEAVLTVLALEHQFVPPTWNLENPDAACALDYTPLRGHTAVFDRALSVSFGFGGPIGALVMSSS